MEVDRTGDVIVHAASVLVEPTLEQEQPGERHQEYVDAYTDRHSRSIVTAAPRLEDRGEDFPRRWCCPPSEDLAGEIGVAHDVLGLERKRCVLGNQRRVELPMVDEHDDHIGRTERLGSECDERESSIADVHLGM